MEFQSEKADKWVAITNYLQSKNIELMTEAISNIKVGQITYALRDTEIEGVKIKKDDFMGLNEGKLYNGVTAATINSMREMISVADLTFPNYT